MAAADGRTANADGRRRPEWGTAGGGALGEVANKLGQEEAQPLFSKEDETDMYSASSTPRARTVRTRRQKRSDGADSQKSRKGKGCLK